MITMKIHLLDPRARELINQLEAMDLLRVEYAHQGDQGKPGEMVKLVAEQLDEIRSLCRQYKMKKVWLFGSATDAGQFHLDSDVDFLYEIDEAKVSKREFLDYPLALQKALSELLGRNVDFIANQPFRNPYLQAEIDETKQLIYDHEETHQKAPAGH